MGWNWTVMSSLPTPSKRWLGTIPRGAGDVVSGFIGSKLPPS